MRSYGFTNIFNSYKLLLILMVMVIGMTEVKGQDCEIKTRTYANFQGNNVTGLNALVSLGRGTITNPTLAIDGNTSSSTSLSVLLGLLNASTATQFLEFTTNGTHSTKRTIPAGTPVTVKLSFPKEVLGLLSGVSIGTFGDLTPVRDSNPVLGISQSAGYAGNDEKEIYSGTTLLGLLNGSGEAEITFTPTTPYSGIYVRLSSVLSLGLSANVFHAYIMEDTATETNCNTAIDVISGAKATGGLSLLNVTGTVTNPENSIDPDPTVSTYTLMSAGAQVLSKVYETIIFNQPSIPGDSIKFVLQNTAETILDLTLFSDFTIQPYLGNIAAGPPFLSNSSLITLRLIPASDNKYELILPVNTPYDKVEISMNGVVNLLSNLRVYDVKRVIAKPSIHAASLTNQNLTLCVGQTTALNISNIQTSPCITYTWYKNNELLSPIGPTYQLPVSLTEGTHNYKVIATRSGCMETSESVPIKVTVNPKLPNPHIDIHSN